MLEILKLFVVLAVYLTERRIVLAQYFSVCAHFSLLWTMLSSRAMYTSAMDTGIAAQVSGFNVVVSNWVSHFSCRPEYLLYFCCFVNDQTNHK
jgi:hypothetical protein